MRVCVCVHIAERERKRSKEGDSSADCHCLSLPLLLSLCVCVCVCVCVRVCEVCAGILIDEGPVLCGRPTDHQRERKKEIVRLILCRGPIPLPLLLFRRPSLLFSALDGI